VKQIGSADGTDPIGRPRPSWRLSNGVRPTALIAKRSRGQEAPPTKGPDRRRRTDATRSHPQREVSSAAEASTAADGSRRATRGCSRLASSAARQTRRVLDRRRARSSGNICPAHTNPKPPTRHANQMIATQKVKVRSSTVFSTRPTTTEPLLRRNQIAARDGRPHDHESLIVGRSRADTPSISPLRANARKATIEVAPWRSTTRRTQPLHTYLEHTLLYPRTYA